MMPEKLWKIVADIELGGQSFNFNLTAGEAGLLEMLRSFYPTFEKQIKAVAEMGAGKRPAGLLDDALCVLRCLVFNRLEPHGGKFVQLSQVK